MSQRWKVNLVTALVAPVMSFVCAIPAVHALENHELWPCHSDVLEDIDWRARVLAVLFPEAIRDTSFRCVVIPAFDPEWAVIFDCSTEHDATLEYRVAEANVWYSNWVPMPTDERPKSKGWSTSPVPIEIAARRGSISYGTCTAVEDLWSVVLNKTNKWRDPGVDGTTYVFFSGAGADESCGEIWSPRDGTLLRRLVQVVEDLGRLANDDDPVSRLALDEDVRKRALQLKEEYRRVK